MKFLCVNLILKNFFGDPQLVLRRELLFGSLVSQIDSVFELNGNFLVLSLGFAKRKLSIQSPMWYFHSKKFLIRALCGFLYWKVSIKRPQGDFHSEKVKSSALCEIFIPKSVSKALCDIFISKSSYPEPSKGFL